MRTVEVAALAADDGKRADVVVAACCGMTRAAAQRLLDEGYLIAPGAMFHAARAASTCMRINFATTQEPDFWQVLVRVVARLST